MQKQYLGDLFLDLGDGEPVAQRGTDGRTGEQPGLLGAGGKPVLRCDAPEFWLRVTVGQFQLSQIVI